MSGYRPDINHIKNFPANLLKFNAYVKVTENLDEAVRVIKNKRLAYGEPCVVTYKAGSDSEGKPIFHVLFAIGSMKDDEPYLVNVYGSDGGYAPIDEVMPVIYEILEKFGGRQPVRIKLGKAVNVTDEYRDGDIVLGDAAVKQVLETLDKDSMNLVTSKGIYDYFKNFADAIGETVVDLGQRLDIVDASIALLFDLEERINTIDTSVADIYIKLGAHDASITQLYEIIGPDSSSLPDRTYAVVGGKGIEVSTTYGITTVSADYENLMEGAVSEDDTALQLDASNRIGVYWGGFD